MTRAPARVRDVREPRIRTGAVGVATIAAVSALMAACESTDDVRIRSVTGEPSWRLLSVGINTCNADLSADVEETAEEVRIRVHAENDTTDDCRDYMRVTLDDALGHRRVIDDRIGAELRVSSPLAQPGAAGIGDPVRDGDLTFTVTAVGEEARHPSVGSRLSSSRRSGWCSSTSRCVTTATRRVRSPSSTST